MTTCRSRPSTWWAASKTRSPRPRSWPRNPDAAAPRTGPPRAPRRPPGGRHRRRGGQGREAGPGILMPLHFELVTPERLVRSDEVHMVVVPGTEGDFGVLEGHAPFMSTIRNGDLLIHRSSGRRPGAEPAGGGLGH